MASLETEFDLSDLIEQVVEVQYFGQKLPKAALHLNNKTPPNYSEAKESELSVIVSVQDVPSWHIKSVPGAWRRIVMNLLGNSLKWTEDGFVEVSLSKVNRKQNSTSAFAVLSVTDTGAGIARDFLRHNVFSPFTQENDLSEGLGLGLSTVRQLVASLDGHLNVQSEIGIGTQVDIFVPIEIQQPPPSVPPSLSTNDQNSEGPPSSVCLVGLNDYPGLQETPTGILPNEAKRKLAVRSSLSAILAQQIGWNVVSSELLGDSHSDVAIVEEQGFHAALNSGHLSLKGPEGSDCNKFFIILDSKTPAYIPVDPSNLVRVTQPCVLLVSLVSRS